MAAHHASIECSRRAMLHERPWRLRRPSGNRLRMRHARSSSCYRRSTASAGKVASRLFVSSILFLSSMFAFIKAAKRSSATRRAVTRRRASSTAARGRAVAERESRCPGRGSRWAGSASPPADPWAESRHTRRGAPALASGLGMAVRPTSSPDGFSAQHCRGGA